MLETQIKRVIMIVLDGVGVGEAPDAAAYGDEGSNSLGNTAAKIGGISLPNLQALGFGNIIPIEGVPPKADAKAAWGRLQPISAGKDSITGHWELMGVYLEKPFPTYPNGFPDDLLEVFAREGMEFIGNKVASGTEIIQEFGAEHLHTHKPILYTSADSVFQIASHEEIIPIEELYAICEKARKILDGEHRVARVIARPFVGSVEEGFTRTERRHDYSVEPLGTTVLDSLSKNGIAVHAVGKIYDLFSGRGITKNIYGKSNKECIQALIDDLHEDFEGLVFVNLVEFDMIFGHRNDAEGYAKALQEFDSYLPEIMSRLTPNDLVMISADHGVDPTTPSTDHSREYVPLLIFGEAIQSPVDLGDCRSLGVVGASIAELFGVEKPAMADSLVTKL